jgi:hypothetical protein
MKPWIYLGRAVFLMAMVINDFASTHSDGARMAAVVCLLVVIPALCLSAWREAAPSAT